jgi:excisionase family DNA binding protein
MLATEEQLLTVAEVAERLQVAIETVRRWIRRGDLTAYKLEKTGASRSATYSGSYKSIERMPKSN